MLASPSLTASIAIPTWRCLGQRDRCRFTLDATALDATLNTTTTIAQPT